jgi:methyl-accepting chemotaxis protein
MSSAIARGFGNIAIRYKLAWGFGLVICFALAIAYVGYAGVTSMIDRAERVQDIATVNTLARDVRIARLAYSVNSDAQNATNWAKSLDALKQHVIYAKGHFTSPVNLGYLETITSYLNEYDFEYDKQIKSTVHREAARTEIANYAEQGLKELALIDDYANSNQADGLAAHRTAQGLTLFQKMRFDVRGYTSSVTSTAEADAMKSIAETVSYIAGLHGKGLPETSVDKVELALNQYQKSVMAFSADQVKIAETQTGINRIIKGILGAADDLSANQVRLRNEDANAATTMLAIGTIILVVLSILSAWLIARMIVTPLLATLVIAENVANGDLTHDRVSTRKDEIGQLETSMQKMTKNLRGLIGGLKEGVIQIASAAESLSAVTEQTSAGVNVQKLETDQVATAMQEMTATVQEVAKNAEQASEAALVASRETREGDATVSEALSRVERLATEVSKSKQAMDDLKLESNKIGGVLDVIQSVAQQTNLLALNAAIEAARAGDAGRGFAVVADEVRSLAQRTQTSTEEIASLIASLHGGTDRVSTMLDSSKSLTDDTLDLARQAGSSLERISRSVSDIESMNQQIATAVEQQSAVAEEINRSVLSVRDVSEQTAVATEKTSASSVELARLSVDLQKMVGAFRI